MSQSKAVAVLPEKEKSLDVYSKVGGLDPYLDQIRAQVDEFKNSPPKLDTAKGRDEYRSMAYKVSRMKTALEDMGKDLSAEAKSLPKKIDAERKRSWDILEAWQKEILDPVAQWDAEQKRLEEIRLAEEAAKALAIEIESDHEIALILYADHLRKQEEAAKAAEQLRIDNENRIAKEAAELATKQANEAAAKLILDAQLAVERAQREKAESEAAALKAKHDAETATRLASEKAERDRLQAIEDERARVAIENARLAKIKQDEDALAAKQAANKAHQKKINNELLDDLIELGCNKELGIKIVTALAKNTLSHAKIIY